MSTAQVAEAIQEIVKRDAELTRELERLSNWHSYDGPALHARDEFRRSTFERLLALASEAVK
ncbi:hypothetical protein ABM90_31405 [Rhodococcus erythropolis]|nr:hypothetical protein ABM90_31405 [Rhodococcus erythropolis]